MSSSSSLSTLERTHHLQGAWQALSNSDPAQASEFLMPLAHEMSNDRQVGHVWSALLGFIEHEDQLKNELNRVAQAWIKDIEIITQLIKSTFQWSKRTQTHQRPLFSVDSVLFVALEILQFHLEEFPPSQAQKRAELYHFKANLLSLCELEAEEEALKAFEIALSLDSTLSTAWYDLSRLHGLRGRWDKADLALQQAIEMGLDVPQVEWMRLLIATALGTSHQDQAYKALSALGHESEQAVLTPQGRWSFLKLDPVLVSISTHLLNAHGQRDATQEWNTEIVWVHPLNPCYGRIGHPLIGTFSAHFDDLILWDPNPLEFKEIEDDERPIFKAIQVIQKGKANVRSFPMDPLTSNQLTQLNQSLPEGVFYHQSPLVKTPHGKLCWPRKGTLSAVHVFETFQQCLKNLQSRS